MKRLIAGTILLAGLALAALPSALTQSRPSIVAILAKASKGWEFVCSGAVVEFKPGARRVVSAGHCVSETPNTPKNFRVLVGGVEYPVLSMRSEDDWPRSDYSILRSPAVYAVKPLKLSSTPLELGDALYVWHQPLGLAPIPTSGMYLGKTAKSYAKEPDILLDMLTGMMMTSFNSDHGASGSVIVNSKAEAVGILVGGFPASMKLEGVFMTPIPPL